MFFDRRRRYNSTSTKQNTRRMGKLLTRVLCSTLLLVFFYLTLPHAREYKENCEKSFEKSKELQVSISELKSVHEQSKDELVIEVTQLQLKVDDLQREYDGLKDSYELLQETADQHKEEAVQSQTKYDELKVLYNEINARTADCEANLRKQEEEIEREKEVEIEGDEFEEVNKEDSTESNRSLDGENEQEQEIKQETGEELQQEVHEPVIENPEKIENEDQNISDDVQN